MVLICRLIQVLFLGLAVNFSFFNNHFPITTLGLDLFSGTYLNKLLFLCCLVTENNSLRVPLRSMLLCLKIETEPVSKMCIFKKLDDKVPKWNNVSVNFPRALFSHWDFLNLEDGTYRLSRNYSKELPLYAA